MTGKEDTRYELPKTLMKITEEYIWEDHTCGYSGTKVFKLKSQQETIYLKINQPHSDFNLEKEKIILEWLTGKLPVPTVKYFGVDNNIEYLLLSEIQGRNSHIVNSDDEKRTNIEILAKALRIIHDIDIKDCPLDNHPNKLLKIAKLRMNEWSIDPKQFDERWQNKTPQQLYQEILEIKPNNYDLVFSHGDYCLPNIMIHNGQLSGFIDWPYGGINDRYYDFAAVAWSIGYNFGEEWVQLFFDNYGIKKIDWERIKFYQMLNEFFWQ